MQPFFGLSDVHTPTLFPAGVKSFFFQLEIKVFADLAELGLHLQWHHKMTDRSFQVKTVTTSHPILPCSASGVPRGPRRALWCHHLLPPCLSSPSRARALAVPTCRPRRHPSRLRHISPPWPLMEALQPGKEYSFIKLHVILHTIHFLWIEIKPPWKDYLERGVCGWRHLWSSGAHPTGCRYSVLVDMNASSEYHILPEGETFLSTLKLTQLMRLEVWIAFDINYPFLTFLSVCYDFLSASQGWHTVKLY